MNIFLDFDGTLLDGRRRYFSIHSRCLNRKPALTEDEYWELKRSRVPEEEILLRHEPDTDIAAYMVLRMSLLEDDALLMQDTLFPWTDGALTELQAHGTLFLVTLRRRPQSLERQLRHVGLHDRFAAIVVSAPGDDPAATKADLMRLYAQPGDWVAGDTEADIGAGQLLGLHTCGVLSGIRSRALLDACHPDLLLPTIADLPSHLS